MRHRLFLFLLASVVLMTAAAGEGGQQTRPRRAPEQCAHDIESRHKRHRAEARRCARQRNQAQCEAENDRLLQLELAHINSVCGDIISTQGEREPERDRDRDPNRDGDGPPGDVFETGDPPRGRRPPSGSPGGGRPRVRPEQPSAEDSGPLPPGFPFPPAEARPPRTTPHPRQPADSRPVIVALGDSITAGYGLKPEEAWPSVLQRRLDAAGYRYRVVNAGVTRDRTTDALRRLHRALVPNTQILIVALGLNDFGGHRPINETGNNLLKIVGTARQRGISVLLCGFDALPAFDQQYERDFKGMYPQVAARTGVPLIRDLMARVYDVHGMTQHDLVHPSAAGSRVIAEDVFNALRPMLGPASPPRSPRSSR
jgi:acyl-CoA thioesterase I